MSHKCTAVVYDPGPASTELYQFEVNMWYEAFDMLVHEIERRHPYVRRSGVDNFEVRAFSMMTVKDD